MLNKIVKIFGYAVLAITAIIGILFFLQDAPKLQAGLDAIQDMPQELKPAEIAIIAQGWGASVYYWAVILTVLGAVVAVGFAIYKFVTGVIDNPKSAIKPGISIAIIALLVIVAYSMSSDTIPVFLGADNFDISPAESKWVETFIYSMYLLVGFNVLALVYSEVSRIWR
jgi:hypothetical protein